MPVLLVFGFGLGFDLSLRTIFQVIGLGFDHETQVLGLGFDFEILKNQVLGRGFDHFLEVLGFSFGLSFKSLAFSTIPIPPWPITSRIS